jgi:hypothetical protein
MFKNFHLNSYILLNLFKPATKILKIIFVFFFVFSRAHEANHPNFRFHFAAAYRPNSALWPNTGLAGSLPPLVRAGSRHRHHFLVASRLPTSCRPLRSSSGRHSPINPQLPASPSWAEMARVLKLHRPSDRPPSTRHLLARGPI